MLFDLVAERAATFAARPLAFLSAATLIVLWAGLGPVLGFSDTWQLVVNTGTSIVTFLMVFLIQHSQKRDTLALQIKLAELILVVKGAENELATVEEKPEDYLEKLHEIFAASKNGGGRRTAPRARR